MSANNSKITKGDSTLWEQWLSRLGGATLLPVLSETNRLDLIELVLHNRIDEMTFFSRLGTIIARAIGNCVLSVREQTNSGQTIIYSNLEKRVEKKIISQLPLGLRRPRRQVINTNRLEHSVKLNNVQRLRYVTELALPNLPSKKLFTTIATDEQLNRDDLHFLTILSSLIELQVSRARLNTGLLTEKERLSTLTHHLSEGLMTLDKNLRIAIWNRPIQRLTGFSLREASGRPYSEMFRRADEPNWLETLKKRFENEPLRNAFHADFQINCKQNSLCWVSVSGSFLRDNNGKIAQTILIARDISKYKELESRKSDFISIATHELRTPITAIKGYLSMLERDSEGLTEKQRHYLDRATQANNRLVNLAEELLQIVQVEENRLQFSIKAIDPVPITQKVVSDLTSKATKKGLAVTLRLPGQKTTVAADPVRLEQVIANLVDNAIKYTEKGRVEISLVRSYNRSNSSSEFQMTITDTGIGMSGKDLAHIFDKFHRTGAAKMGAEPGAGLGLFIVKSFIEKQGGKISVKSRVGHGSTFTVTMPLLETDS